jgi:hypothetical protein
VAGTGEGGVGGRHSRPGSTRPAVLRRTVKETFMLPIQRIIVSA